MKVLLISVNKEKDPCPAAPIGVAYIAGALRQRDHRVGILDLCFIEDDDSAILTALRKSTPDIIGLSIRNIDNLTYPQSAFYMPRVRHIVDLIKKNTTVPIIAGGSGFSIFPEEALRYLGLDFGIVGEGERAFPLFADALASGGETGLIQGLCRIRDGRFSANGRTCGEIADRPDRSLLDNQTYLELGGMANIQSKRGCPFTCSYCTYPNIEGRQLRLRRPSSVVDELKEMRADYGIDYCFFVDDIFNFPEDHAADLCEEIIRSDLEMDWMCFATPKGMTHGLASLMKRAGCKGVEFGSDAGSERTLRGLGKQFTPEDIAYASECCNAIGLPDAHYLIMGGPEEDRSTLEETFALFEKIKPTAVISLTGLRIYPDTQIHSRAVDEGMIEKSESLLEPAFYLSPLIESDALLQQVAGHAGRHHNWIVPGLNIRCDTDTMALLRRMGRKGPLWDMLL